MKNVERLLGTRVGFLLPSLKLKGRSGAQGTFEEDIHGFLMENFDGYTAAAGNLFGYWREDDGGESYGEHRQFTVALADDSKISVLKEYLASLAAQIGEQCIYLEAGNAVSLIYATRRGSGKA
ncbi:MAG: hypothetical protein JWN34_2534 [Bryobacterales bacterium]|jgi:hypothetical protein|nr:hypothetical protein [Bryobacterales bacterium]